MVVRWREGAGPRVPRGGPAGARSAQCMPGVIAGLLTFPRYGLSIPSMESGDAVIDSVAAASGPPGRFGLAGKSILITGATGALGSAAARHCAGRGAADAGGRQRGPARRGGCGAARGRPAAVVTVLRRPETPADAAAMVQAAVQAHGGLDGVLVASGMNHVAPITEMDVTDFDRVLDANVRGSWLVCQAAGRQLLEQGDGGSVVLVSSTRGRLGHPAGTAPTARRRPRWTCWPSRWPPSGARPGSGSTRSPRRCSAPSSPPGCTPTTSKGARPARRCWPGSRWAASPSPRTSPAR